ncbi:OmpP1/FadL family transporter [Thermodesulfobacteriota bacterium]
MMMHSIEQDSIVHVVLIVLILLLILPHISPAATQIHGAKAAGMGTAFVAIADDLSAMVYNPAGLTLSKGTHVYAGATAVMGSSDYKSPLGASEDTEFQVFFPPHLYISSDFDMQDKVLGLAIFSHFGIGGRKWDQSGLTRYADTESFITTMAVNPTFAWEIKPGLSIGFGVFYMYSKNEAERMINQSLAGAGDAKFNLDVDGGGWGYNLGILVTPSKKFSYGIAYRSGVKVDLSGDVKLENIASALHPLFGGSHFKTDAHTTLDFPDIVSLGFAYRPTEKLNLGLDFEWVGWSSFDKQNLDFENEVPEAGLSDTSTILDWEDIWMVKIGVEYRVNDRISLRTGYAYSETFVPEYTLSPGYPDSDKHNLSIGLGYRIKNWVIDTFYTATFYQDRTVNNSILSGEYESSDHYIGVSIGYRF